MTTTTHSRTELGAIQAEVHTMPPSAAIPQIQRIVRRQPSAAQHPRQYPYDVAYWADGWRLMTITCRWWSKGEHSVFEPGDQVLARPSRLVRELTVNDRIAILERFKAAAFDDALTTGLDVISSARACLDALQRDYERHAGQEVAEYRVFCLRSCSNCCVEADYLA